MLETSHKKVQSILYLSGVTKSFDGFKAINNLSLDIAPGELRAIIGPNGAGKSTMMDIITGKTKPDEGDVKFKDTIDLTRHDETDIANMGIGRKFQKPTVIESLTVWDNMELALAGNRGIFQTLFWKLSDDKKLRIEEIIKQIGLAEKTDDLAQNLSHGQKQWLEIGMLLIQEPEVLLVDEPAGGMTDYETMETAKLLKEISQEHSVIVVEHDMDFVRALDCKVTVLHEGSVLAEGTLDKVSSDKRVVEVYLGR
ncbi:urea ABC transporter ATP-binding protein UrtD [Saccharophagus degradans]|uniref:Histidine kinase n=2 Tax=Saccharophagus degradans TaxID=86304 RepID=Q21P86_SACD2|nr:urea ABC transporter ATP-binding protein UrtD [Saccharophagus degradans]ABD79493.1 histidine kinase [Saccharophagus degradans 2-40]MBU2986898.1 urea ABC transporter ATP-binding protein UrtD [Saccharophagus degradans]MDO6423298.1 urea ABC transporter ATP-binding protein UrtD [Saccharophagus degradans]MDO6606703.1 urea ABC transporter ATP-binding protein UrtD [Saccharophagus degradans]WGO98363.1 urea ABC transporter ATP-binding protein UrtD [Saccharophagus degradans]